MWREWIEIRRNCIGCYAGAVSLRVEEWIEMKIENGKSTWERVSLRVEGVD